MDFYKLTLSLTTLSVFGQIGLGIHMSRVMQDALHLIYGKTTLLQITVYLAPIQRSQIKRSVVCCDCWTVTYPVGIREGTLIGSWWHEPVCWYLASDKVGSILLRRRQVRWYLGIIAERYGWCGRNCVTERRRRWKTRRKRRDGGRII